MTRIEWGAVGERYFEAGVDRGVLYVEGLDGVPWNGLISVNDSPQGGEPELYYFDGEVYLIFSNKTDFKGNITALYSPEEFDRCDGVQTVVTGMKAHGQDRTPFGLSYRTYRGNDVLGVEAGYVIHLVYNATASPTSRTHATLNDSVNPEPLSWDIVAKPVPVPGFTATAHLSIPTSEIPSTNLAAIEDILYGSESNPPRLLTPQELIEFLSFDPDLVVVDNGDGTFTITAPDERIVMLDPDTFQIDTVAASYSDSDTYALTYNG